MPNKLGKDKFNFYITHKKNSFSFNSGNGNFAVATRISKTGGLYPDGYGFSREIMKNDSYRGCNSINASVKGAFCSALIIYIGVCLLGSGLGSIFQFE